jgi:membrane-associated protease RseP (regulator of RpoE activity)
MILRPTSIPEALGLLFVVLCAALVHEAGHLAMAGLLRIPVRRLAVGFGPVAWRKSWGAGELVLRVLPLGLAVGVAGRRRADGTPVRPAWHDLLLALGGPAASLGLFLALALLAGVCRWPGAVGAVLQTAAIVSAVLGVANLLPIPGLDGGHCLLLAGAGLGWSLAPARQVMLRRAGLALVSSLCLVVPLARLARIA